MIKLGILDFDTSHAVEFTKRLNHKIIAEDQWVNGAQVVIGCAGESRMAPQRIKEYTPQMEKLGVSLVDKPAEMIGKVDGMLIESLEGGPHLERARPFLEAGIPCFIDKPFACKIDDARAMVRLAEKHKVPIFSASSLRYSPELVAYLADNAKHGKIQGAIAYGPAELSGSEIHNPGLFHYGIHAVEILYTVMGPGCRRVTCTHEKGVDVVTGQWDGGRVATVRGLRDGARPFGCLAFTDKGAQTVPIGTAYIYRELLKKVVSMFETRKAPLDPAVTVEMVGFMEAALKSAANHGAGEAVPGL